MTPEMFAEYRDDGPNAKNQLAAIRYRQHRHELPPGPAFFLSLNWRPCDCRNCRQIHKVPEGYLWQPATDHTPAGWVRPHAEAQPKPGFTKYGQPINSDDMHELADVWKGR